MSINPSVRRALACGMFGVVLLTLGSCVSQKKYQSALRTNESLHMQLADLKGLQNRMQAENQELGEQVRSLGVVAADANWIKDQKKELERLLASYKEGGTNNIPGVTMVRTGEGVAFRMQGEVLFSAGQAVITDSGKTTLKALAKALEREGKMIRVDGHTDAQPIRRSKWKSNLDLSIARSLAVAAYLKEQGFPAERLSVAGYGEFRPEVQGASDAALRQNRRVEVLMLDA